MRFTWLVLIAFLVGCSYSVNTRRYENVQSIYVKSVANDTYEYEAGDYLKKHLTSKIDSMPDILLATKPTTGAADLSVTLLSYERTLHSLDTAGNPKDYVYSIRVSYVFASGEVVLDEVESYYYREIVSATMGNEKDHLMQRLSENLLRDILEGF